MTLRLRHLEVFHAVYEHGSVSGAARALAVSQPAATQLLRHAEALIGFPLFRRHQGRLVPTADAHVLIGEARAVADRVAAFHLLARNLKRGGANRLSVSALPVLGLGVLPAAVATHLELRRELTFDLHTDHHEEIGRKLAARDTEIVLAFEPPGDAPVTTIPLGGGRLGVFHRRGELAGVAPADAVAALAGLRFVSVAGSGPIGALIAAELGRMNIAVHEVAAARTFHIAAELARAGVGVTIIDEFTARASMSADMDFLPIEPALQFDVVAIHASDRPPSAMMLEFLRIVADSLPGHKPGL